MTIAELKRKLVPGTELILIRNIRGECNQKRVVKTLRSNCVGFIGEGIEPGQESYFYFPKPSALESTENGFKIVIDGRLCAEYVFV